MNKLRVTLDRVLSKAGIASRTTSREWIRSGRVKVNGRIVKDPDFWVEQKDVVHFDGARVHDEKKVYLALNKPAGLVTSFGDNHGRGTVYECLKEYGRWVFPVGRLDMDTSGLLILTNDTDFGEALLRPEGKIPKTYYLKVAGAISAGEYFKLALGVEIGRGENSGPARVHEVRCSAKYTWLELTITEGKNRQVRRMCDAIGHPVLKLVRIRIGDYSLGDIPVGEYRVLNGHDLRRLLVSPRRFPGKD